MAACKSKAKSAEKKAERDKVVLAYSGGLDTSVAIHWLQEKYNVDVIAIAINVGQPPARTTSSPVLSGMAPSRRTTST